MPNAGRKPNSKSRAPRASRKGAVRGRGDFSPAPTKDSLPQAVGRIERKLDSALKKPTDSLGSGLGRLAGNFVGAGELGAQAGDKLSKWLGFGDYELHTNSLIKGDVGTKSSSIPTFSKDGKRGIRLTEREYLGDILASSTPGAFKNTSYRINPGDSVTFPWLSTVAAQFEEWEPLGIIFEFVSTSSEYNGTSQALGTVIMATDYDPVDPAASNKLVMEQMDYSRSAKCSHSQSHGVECDMKERPTKSFYVATSCPSVDLRLHDLGNFQIATFGCSTANVNLGELWVTYDVALYKKQLLGGQVGGTVSTAVLAGTTMSSNYPLGLTTSRFNGDSLALTSSNSGAGTVTVSFPPNIQVGTYLVHYYLKGTTLATTGNVLQAGTNTSYAPWFAGGPSTWEGANSSTALMATSMFNVTGPNASFTLSSVTMATGTSATMVVTQVNPESPFYTLS